MTECRSCQKPLTEKDEYCPFCGYDPKIDAINPNVKLRPPPLEKKSKEKKGGFVGGGLNPKAKAFIVAGIAILVFSILYKYNFNLNLVAAKINYLLRLKSQKPSGQNGLDVSREEKKDVKLEWSDVKAFESSKKAAEYLALVIEGIFFDPTGKSFVTINGQVIPEGEFVRGAEVKKIDRNSVELLIDGELKTVSVNQSIPLPKNK